MINRSSSSVHSARRGGRFRLLLCALACVGIVTSAQAALTTLTFQPTPTDMYDLDHHYVYTWRIDNITVTPGYTISGATLSITNIANWDSNPNVLHLHLLDTAINPGVASFYDSDGSPVTDLTDDFISTRYHNDPNWLVKNGTADTFMADPSFTTTPVNYTLNFNASQLATLSAYIANGKDIAWGLDPDCHFFNDGITFCVYLTPVPEMSALFPLVGLIAAVGFTRLLHHRRRSAQAKAVALWR